MSVLTSDTEARLPAFRRTLAWSDHSFKLLFVAAAPGRSRNAILERLRAWSGRDGVPELVEIHLRTSERPVSRLRHEAGAVASGSGLVLIGLDQYVTYAGQATPAMQELNFFRDELPELVHGPLVLVASPDTITHILAAVPDLASFRAFVLTIKLVEDDEPVPAYPPLVEPISEPPAITVERLMASLGERRLKTLLDSGPPGTSGDRITEAEKAEICLRLSRAALPVYGHDRARRWVDEAYEIFCRLADRRGQANCIYAMGEITVSRWQVESAQAQFHDALGRYRRVRDILGEANCLYQLGELALGRVSQENVRAYLEEAAALYHGAGSTLGRGNCAMLLGTVASLQSDPHTACHRYEEALALFDQVGHITGKASCNYFLAEALSNSCPREESRSRIEVAIGLYRSVADIRGEARCIRSMGELETSHKAARAYHLNALSLCRRVDYSEAATQCTLTLGWDALYLRDIYEALDRFESARSAYGRVKDSNGEARCLLGLGACARAWGQLVRAEYRFSAALELFRRVGNTGGVAVSYYYLGWIAYGRGEQSAARGHVHRALQLSRRGDNRYLEAHCLKFLGELTVADRDSETARGLYAEARRLYLQLKETHEIAKVEAALAAVADPISTAESLPDSG